MMTQSRERRGFRGAFTLIEMLVVIAIIAVLAALLLPALEQARARTQTTSCLSNLRQMQAGWQMYANDFGDILLPNAPVAGNAQKGAGYFPSSYSWCGKELEGWTSLDGNTNFANYVSTVLAPYVTGQIRVFKCAADRVPSVNGQRLRSYSMNGQLGQYLPSHLSPDLAVNSNPGFRVYNMVNDMTCPGASMTWVFCDEHPGSVDDGFLTVSMSIPAWPDVPASYHRYGSDFSFGDGHAEFHPWASPALKIPIRPQVAVHNVQTVASNPDYVWFSQRSTCQVREQ